MTALEEIVDHVATNFATWTKAENLFGDTRPEWRSGSPNRSLFIFQQAEGAPVWGIGGRSSPIMENVGFQFLFRSKYPSEALSDAEAVYLQLPPLVMEATLGTTLWHSLLPAGRPSLVDRDSNERTIYVVNFRGYKQVSS